MTDAGTTGPGGAAPLRVRELARVLRHRDFRLLWLGQSASQIGNRLVLVALALFVIDLTGSATDVGLVLAANVLPLLAFLLIGGVWADRLPRHRVMIASDLVRFALHALLAVLILTGAVRVWHIVVIEALFGVAQAFFQPAYSGLVPQTVPEDEVQEANALTGLVSNVAEFAGPALATALVLGVGAGVAFALDAVTFLLSAALLARVRPRARGEEPTVRASLLAEMRDGWSAVRSRAWVWVTIVVFCASLLLGLAPYFVLGPVVAEEQYGSTGVYGAVTSAIGVGTVAGSIVALRWRPHRPMRMAMLLAILWPAASVLFALGLPLALVLPAAAASGLSVALFDVWWMTALAERIPPHLLSRVTAYDWLGSLALLPLGYLLAGPLGEALGASTVLLGGSVLAMACLALGLLPRETRALTAGPQPNSGVPSSGVDASA